MKTSNKIIFATILLILLLTIAAIVVGGIFNNDDTANNNENISGINWNYDLQSAIEESKKTNKSVFLYIGASWCHNCDRIESETFSNKDVQNKINENYIPVKVDSDETPELISKYNVMGVPTILIIDSNEELIDCIVGFQTSDELLSKLANI